VQGAKNGARESGFVGAMVDLARCVGARAIAEMIETEAQAGIMSNLGVEFGQGWLFGKPGSLPGSL
jgi:EAL domain-containing protein (putative c-di-GMP-specific phosphodiesterase class I)